jgi:hypothetical protein
MTIPIGRYTFEGPFSYTSSLKSQSGVYAILTPSGGSYKVLDIGESENVRTRIENHDRQPCWNRNKNGSIFYAAYYCGATNRMLIERELRNQFNPPCGER